MLPLECSNFKGLAILSLVRMKSNKKSHTFADGSVKLYNYFESCLEVSTKAKNILYLLSEQFHNWVYTQEKWVLLSTKRHVQESSLKGYS